jgi:hypothetical protein
VKSVAKKIAECGTKHRCVNHPDRFAAVSVQGMDLCWECHLGKSAFEYRFGREFYQPGSPGYAGD